MAYGDFVGEMSVDKLLIHYTYSLINLLKKKNSILMVLLRLS
jgi:hypothetical protein